MGYNMVQFKLQNSLYLVALTKKGLFYIPDPVTLLFCEKAVPLSCPVKTRSFRSITAEMSQGKRNRSFRVPSKRRLVQKERGTLGTH